MLLIVKLTLIPGKVQHYSKMLHLIVRMIYILESAGLVILIGL